MNVWIFFPLCHLLKDLGKSFKYCASVCSYIKRLKIGGLYVHGKRSNWPAMSLTKFSIIFKTLSLSRSVLELGCEGDRNKNGQTGKKDIMCSFQRSVNVKSR